MDANFNGSIEKTYLEVRQLYEGKEKIKASRAQIEAGKLSIEEGKKQIEEGQKEINKYKEIIKQKEVEIVKITHEYKNKYQNSG